MLKTEQIVRLNSNDISVDTNHTRTIVSKLWDNATNKEKKKAVSIGGYKDTRSFSPVRNQGNISVRMAVTLAQVFNVDPYFIIGKKTNDEGFSEAKLNAFLKDQGFDEFITRRPITNDTLVDYATEIIKSIDITEKLRNLPEDELIKLMEALIIQADLGNLPANLKLDIIKRILVF